MCTVITWKSHGTYFGRNMDLDYHFGETIVVVPRQFPLDFHYEPRVTTHHALIGMASIVDGTPLFSEAMNEYGLAMAGLNFPSQVFGEVDDNHINITPYEIIPYILGRSTSVREAKTYLQSIQFISTPFKEGLPVQPLHFILSDEHESVVIESTTRGLEIYEDTLGVLTNQPTFDFHMTNLNHYLHLSPKQPVNTFDDALALTPFGQGAGSIGLPGDSSPTSRFVQAAFLKAHAKQEQEESKAVTQLFHMLDRIKMVKGTVILPNDRLDLTTYSTVMALDTGMYYYKTYNNSQISAVSLDQEDLDQDQLIHYDLIQQQHIHYVNKREQSD
ncbi:choloylglycine hydrolase [Halolactibacillus miurensis]|uniref:choloylglycine hydrolase n=1 Tax=Halolactibacillus miurensis TaxID=306541 RepID=A0A1I6Q0I3_9BACI|nr:MULTISPECIES: choloylglycine hydrolase [Halolactibacillus]GEM05338.1 choloylglycine hydrolase [Halolactibacillus miurensis]SFS45943.1 choloylglycine hydrolase [Halolactibacillus miurensis]